MNHETRLMTRRAMLRRSLVGVVGTAALPSFLGRSFLALDANAQAVGLGGGGPILVVVQLNGGNDSLNTIVPLDGAHRSDYEAARPNLAIPRHLALPIGGGFGLHPSLQRLKRLWDGDGSAPPQLGIVHGIGYGNPNLSHFKSTDFWHTALPNGIETSGWLGRFFDHQCASGNDCEPTIGLNLHVGSGLAFRPRAASAGVTVPSLDSFRWKETRPALDRGDRTRENVYRDLVGLGPLPIDAPDDDVLAFARQSAANAMVGARRIQDAAASSKDAGFDLDAFLAGQTAAGARNPLRENLARVAAMIIGGAGTSVYYVDQTGYDTHARQYEPGNPVAGTHARLLADLDEALGDFADLMRRHGHWDRIVVMTVSEFGRKVVENGSRGTDHGAAQSLFLLGGRVRPGFHGTYPALTETEKFNSIAARIDFRHLYRRILVDWLGVPSSQIDGIVSPINLPPLQAPLTVV